MKNICQHCGALNLPISSFCSRCARPLDPPHKSPPPPAAESSSTDARRRDLSASSAQTPAAEPRRPLPMEDTPAVPTPVRDPEPQAELPPPPAPPAREAVQPTPLPIAVPDEPTTPQVLDVTVASGVRVALAKGLDVLVVAILGWFIAWVEVTAFHRAWTPRGVLALDWIADWIHQYQGPALHGFLAAVVLGGAFHLESLRRTGRTVGRWATGTWLAHRSGEPLSLGVLLARSALSLLSVALGGLGYLWAFTDARFRTWHDLLTGTVTVQRVAAR